ncbi:MAG: hypothetical protein PHQ59_05365 [Candidatus Daviesbacteria bacterium]|nr:hypothetical protein [Candidatus Daviesbacteria bacterium]
MEKVVTLRWPDEVSRSLVDTGDQVEITRQKFFFGKTVSVSIKTSINDQFEFADLSIEGSDHYELGYTFNGSFAGISGRNFATDLGIIEYNCEGYINLISLEPVERFSDKFWRLHVPPEDKKIMAAEEIAYLKRINDITKAFGMDSLTAEAVIKARSLCVIAEKYIRKLEMFSDRETRKLPILKCDGEQWLIGLSDEDFDRKYESIQPGQWLLNNGEGVLIDTSKQKDLSIFSFQQISLGENGQVLSKTVTVPARIDYSVARRLVLARDFWEDFFTTYPVSLETSQKYPTISA